MDADSPVGKKKRVQIGHDTLTKRSERTLDDSEDVEMLSSMPPETANREVSVKSKRRKVPTARGKGLTEVEFDSVWFASAEASSLGNP